MVKRRPSAAQVIQGFVAGFIAAAQVQGYMNQGVFGRDIGVYGEEVVMAGVAAAKCVGGGAGEGWIGDNLLHGLLQTMKLAPSHYHMVKAAAVREVVNRARAIPAGMTPPAHSCHSCDAPGTSGLPHPIAKLFGDG